MQARAAAAQRQRPRRAQQPRRQQPPISPPGGRRSHGWRLHRRVPALHALGPVVGMQLGHLHGLGAQAGTEALDQLLPGHALPCMRIGRQQAMAGLGHGPGLQAAQRHVARWCGQPLAAQALGQQAAQVRHVLLRLGGAQHQRLPGGQLHAIVAAQVVAPGQFQCQHALVARAQPALQGQQQALGRAQQRGAGFGQCGQLHLQRKLRGQLDPGSRLGGITPGLVERGKARGAKAPRHPRARQGAQRAPGAAAQVLQGLGMRAQCRQRGQGQIVRQAPGRRPTQAGLAQQGQGLEGGGALGPVLRRLWPTAGGLRTQQCAQGGAPAPQALGALHFQQQGFIQQRHARREAQGPPALRCRRHARRQRLRGQAPGVPVHGERPPSRGPRPACARAAVPGPAVRRPVPGCVPAATPARPAAARGA